MSEQPTKCLLRVPPQSKAETRASFAPEQFNDDDNDDDDDDDDESSGDTWCCSEDDGGA